MSLTQKRIPKLTEPQGYRETSSGSCCHAASHREAQEETGLPDRLTPGWSQPRLAAKVARKLSASLPIQVGAIVLTDLKEWGWNNCSLTSWTPPSIHSCPQNLYVWEAAGGGLVNSLVESCPCTVPPSSSSYVTQTHSWPLSWTSRIPGPSMFIPPLKPSPTSAMVPLSCS